MVSNRHRTVLYIGVTSNLSARAYEHKHGYGASFAKKYNCTDVIYFECFPTIEEAIEREKQLKNWRRQWKEDLIRKSNPEMKDLYDEVEELK
ncbi:GIY-YIG nuclease family protein [Fulvivirga ulvae]|uniref:GIY-YIG nuclease family protein n=1 Tax=Fulvivirga ulvae TaxID=2904245 RepID=UPI0027951F2D|nr:GIY-YIG nuclease family protein [Fulvivirga ulvae]